MCNQLLLNLGQSKLFSGWWCFYFVFDLRVMYLAVLNLTYCLFRCVEDHMHGWMRRISVLNKCFYYCFYPLYCYVIACVYIAVYAYVLQSDWSCPMLICNCVCFSPFVRKWQILSWIFTLLQSVNKPPSVLAAWQALYRPLNLPLIFTHNCQRGNYYYSLQLYAQQNYLLVKVRKSNFIVIVFRWLTVLVIAIFIFSLLVYY